MRGRRISKRAGWCGSVALSALVIGCTGSSKPHGGDGGRLIVPLDAQDVTTPGDGYISHLPYDSGGPVVVCNGASSLCERAYDRVVFLGTHRSMAAGTAWVHPTQGRTLTEQLNSGGVRVIELELHWSNGALALCVGTCADGSQSLPSALGVLANFLQQNPRDVLTLIIRSQVAPNDLVPALDSAGLTGFAHAQTGPLWPTLAEMIGNDERLVVFEEDLPTSTDAGLGSDAADAGDGGNSNDSASPDSGTQPPAWLHRLPDWFAETTPSVAQDCVPASGNGPLIGLNHYVLGSTPTTDELLPAHDPTVVATRLQRCFDDRGRLPSFLLVDFAEIGDPNGGVQIANGLR